MPQSQSNLGPQQLEGPFIGTLMQGVQEPGASPGGFSGYGGKSENILGIATKFLQGWGKGRVQKFAHEETQKLASFEKSQNLYNQAMQAGLTDEGKRQIQGAWAQLVMGKTHEAVSEGAKQEGPAGHFFKGVKGAFDAATGAKQLKGAKIDENSLAQFDSLVAHTITDPKFSSEETRKATLAQAGESLNQIAKETQERVGGQPFLEDIMAHPGFQKVASQLHATAPDQARETLATFLTPYRKKTPEDEARERLRKRAAPPEDRAVKSGSVAAKTPQEKGKEKQQSPPAVRGNAALTGTSAAPAVPPTGREAPPSAELGPPLTHQDLSDLSMLPEVTIKDSVKMVGDQPRDIRTITGSGDHDGSYDVYTGERIDSNTIKPLQQQRAGHHGTRRGSGKQWGLGDVPIIMDVNTQTGEMEPARYQSGPLKGQIVLDYNKPATKSESQKAIAGFRQLIFKKMADTESLERDYNTKVASINRIPDATMPPEEKKRNIAALTAQHENTKKIYNEQVKQATRALNSLYFGADQDEREEPEEKESDPAPTFTQEQFQNWLKE